MSLYSSFLRKLIPPFILRRDNWESAIRHWRFFEESQFWPRQKLLNYQWEKLRHLIKYSYENTIYYRRVFIDEEFSYPLNTGKRIRGFDLVKELSQYCDISYLAYGNPDSEADSNDSQREISVYYM